MKTKKYEIKKNGYINKETDEWRFVETVDVPELEFAKQNDTTKKDDKITKNNDKWLI
ncbi:hypothetical protein MCAMS1_00032 [biofilm metagenome]